MDHVASADKGNVVVGCLMGLACQIAFILIGIFGLFAGNTIVLLVGWGATQWIALIPMILRERANGHPATAQGMIIMGCIGLLLSSACATRFIVPGWAPKMAG